MLRAMRTLPGFWGVKKSSYVWYDFGGSFERAIQLRSQYAENKSKIINK